MDHSYTCNWLIKERKSLLRPREVSTVSASIRVKYQLFPGKGAEFVSGIYLFFLSYTVLSFVHMFLLGIPVLKSFHPGVGEK